MGDPDFLKLSCFSYLEWSTGMGILLLCALFNIIPLLAETDFDPFGTLDLICLQNEWLSCSPQADTLDPQL